MKKNYIIQIIILSLTLIGGCKKNDAQITDNKKTNSGVMPEQATTPSPSVIQNKAVEKKLISQSINNNGEKISYTTDKLLTGTIVYNHAISEQGIVTGTIFITLKNDNMPLKLKNAYDFKKVAQHTYRFLVDKNTDIKLTISDLKQYSSIKNIEMAVNYSPIKEQF